MKMASRIKDLQTLSASLEKIDIKDIQNSSLLRVMMNFAAQSQDCVPVFFASLCFLSDVSANRREEYLVLKVE